jgi:hypothetical protein
MIKTKTFTKIDLHTHDMVSVTEEEFNNFFEKDDIRTYSKFVVKDDRRAYKGDRYIFIEE